MRDFQDNDAISRAKSVGMFVCAAQGSVVQSRTELMFEVMIFGAQKSQGIEGAEWCMFVFKYYARNGSLESAWDS